eukprot:g2132.t1
MEKFTRVDKKKEEIPIEENEVRVTAVGRLFNYVNYAASLYNEKGLKTLVLKGMGRAINKTVTLAEIIKRRVPGLHQVMNIGSVEITDTWEPKEEGLNDLEITRHVSVISITLSSDPPNDTTHPGYQPPLPPEEVKPLLDDDTEGTTARRGRGRGRGRGFGRGGWRGRGRGRGRSSENPSRSHDKGPVTDPHDEGDEVVEELLVEEEEHVPEVVDHGTSYRGRGRARRMGWRGGRGRGGGGGGGRSRGGRGRGRGRGRAAPPPAATTSTGTQAANPPVDAHSGVTKN